MRYATLLAGSAAQGEDLVQEVLIRIYPRWTGLSARPGEVLAYVRRAVTNEHTSWRRRWSTRHIRTTDDGEVPDMAVHMVGEPRDELLWQRLLQLPPQQRAALVLRYYEDMADGDIAAVLSCRPATVRAHVSRGLARLRARPAGADAPTTPPTTLPTTLPMTAPSRRGTAMTQPDQLPGELRELLHRRAAGVTGSLTGPALRALAMRDSAARPIGRRSTAGAHALLASAAVLAVAVAVTFFLGRSPAYRHAPAGRTTPTAPYATTTTARPTQSATVRPTTAPPVVPTGGPAKPSTTGPSTVPSSGPSSVPSPATSRPTTPVGATERASTRVG